MNERELAEILRSSLHELSRTWTVDCEIEVREKAEDADIIYLNGRIDIRELARAVLRRIEAASGLENSCQQGAPCGNPDECSDPVGCGFVIDVQDECVRKCEELEVKEWDRWTVIWDGARWVKKYEPFSVIAPPQSFED